MRINKALAWLCAPILLALSVLFPACDLSVEDSVTLTVGIFSGSNWNVPGADNNRLYDEAFERFEAENHGVKIVYRSGTLKEDYSEWLAQQILQGSTPDVFIVLPDDLNLFCSIGVLYNLDDLVENDATFMDASVYSAALETGQWGEGQYTLPFELSPTMMFVNRTLLNEEGIPMPKNDWTWDDFYEICQQVLKDTDNDGEFDQYGCYGFTWQHAVQTNGAALFDDSGSQIKLVGDAVIQATEFSRKLYQLQKDCEIAEEDFDQGKVAFMPMLFSDYRTYKAYPYSLNKYSNFEWDCIPMPAGPNGNNATELNALMFGINSDTKNIHEAWELLKFLVLDEGVQRSIFQYSQGVSVLSDVNDSPEAFEYLAAGMQREDSVVDLKLVGEVIQESSNMPKFRRYNEIMDLMSSNIHDILQGQSNVYDSLLRLQRDMQSILTT